MLLEEKTVQDQIFEAQVERILHSDELRTSEVLRQILKFLMEKTLSGEADQLKEYTVAIDGLGKSSTYDPQHNSAVRIQVGRLRQKLAEYYRGEGKDDLVIVDLPKGRFKLTCEVRSVVSVPAAVRADDVADLAPLPVRPATTELPPKRTFPVWLVGAVAIALAAFFLGRWSNNARTTSAPNWTPELQTIWSPFLDSNRPLVIAIEDPLFVELRSAPGVYIRDRSLNHWADVQSSPTIGKMRDAIKAESFQPSRYYTSFGEANASFLIGNLLGARQHAVSFVRTSQLSLQQLADNNVLFIGVQNLFFDEKVKALPLATHLEPVLEGVRNLEPAPGEPTLYADQYSTAPNEEGVVYALVTHLPGPLMNSDVASFTSNRSAGYVGAVQWLTDPNSSRELVEKLKDPSTGQVARFYQVLLRVQFKDDVPTKTAYVLSRVLR